MIYFAGLCIPAKGLEPLWHMCTVSHQTRILKQLWALRWVITLLMQADGHCLYRAVGDQLGCQTTGAAGARDLWAIRAKAAAYMRAHPDQFIPFMPEAGSPLHTFWPLTALCSLF